MADRHTFPQAGDQDFAANFGQMISHDNISGYVEAGMSISPDYSVPEATITTGVSFIKINTFNISAINEDRLGYTRVVQVPNDTISLVDSDVNYIYVDPDFTTDDNGSYTSYTSQSSAGSQELLIGEVDTINNTVTTHNRNPDGTFQVLEATQDIRLDDDTPIEFGSGSSYDIEYNSSTSDLELTTPGGSQTLSIDTNGNITHTESFTIDGGVLDLNENTRIEHPQYIKMGRGNALFNSPPDSSSNTFHNSGGGGSGYPYTSFENLVIQGRTDKGDVVISNGDGAGTVEPYFSVDQGGVVRTRTGANMVVDGSLTIDGSQISLDHNNDPEIRSVSRVGYSSDSWAGDEMLVQAQGPDFNNGWWSVERASDNAEALRIINSDLDVQIRNGDLIDGSGNVIYDQSAQHVPTSAIEDGGDADTLDGLEGTDYNFREDTLTALNGTDIVSIATGATIGALQSDQTKFRIDTDGSGSGNVEIYNNNTSSFFVKFDESGNVVRLATDLVDGSGNTIYDQSAGHIPTSAIEDGGDADTLDGLDSTDFNVRNDQADVNGTGIFELINGGSGNVSIRGLTDNLRLDTNDSGSGTIRIRNGNSGNTFVRFDNGSGTAFTSDLNFNNNEAQQFRFENRTTDPSNPSVGQAWIRTDI